MAVLVTTGWLVLLFLTCAHAARIDAKQIKLILEASDASEVQDQEASEKKDCLSDCVSSDYRKAVCSALKSGYLKGGQSTDPDDMAIKVTRKHGCTCTADQLLDICGIAVKRELSAQDQCRSKLESRDSTLSKAVCAALRTGKLQSGDHVDADSMVDLIERDKGIKCTSDTFLKMCGLYVNKYKKLIRSSDTCRKKLNRRDQDLARGVCAVLKRGTLKDGNSVDFDSIVDIMYQDKGIQCTPEEYERMCSGMDCESRMISKAGEGSPRDACDFLGEEYEGSQVDEARLAAALYDERKVQCKAEDFTEICSII